MKVLQSFGPGVLGVSGHLPALLTGSAGLAPSLLQHPSSWGVLLLLQRCSTALLGSTCSYKARPPSIFGGYTSNSPAEATALNKAVPSTSTTATATGLSHYATANVWIRSRFNSSTRPAMLLPPIPAATKAWPAAAALVRHLHSSASAPPATAADTSSTSQTAAAPPSKPADSNSTSSSSSTGQQRGKRRQVDAAARVQPGTPRHQQQQRLCAQPSNKRAAVSTKQLTLMLKHAETPQQLLQLLQQHKLQQQGGVLDAIHIATAYHRIGEMCQADAAVAGTAAARQLQQHLDQLLLLVRRQLKAWGLANIIWSCAYTKHVAPPVQLLPALLQPEVLSGANSQSVANVLWALATLEQQVLPQQAEQLVGALVALVAESGVATPHHISNTLWALGKMGQQVPEDQLSVLLAGLSAQSRRAKPQELANSIWGVAKLGQQVRDRKQVQQLVAAFVSKRSTAMTQSIANLAWAVSEMGLEMPDEQLELLLAAFAEQLNRADPQHVANMLLAYARLRHVPVQLLAALQQQEHMQRFLAAANAQDLGNAAWACGMLGHNCELLLGGLLQQAEKLLQQDSRFDCQTLCNLCWAVAVLDLRQYVPVVLQLAHASSNVWGSAAPEGLRQLYQVHLWLLDHSLAATKGGNGPGLLQVLSQQQLDQCRRTRQGHVAANAAAAPSPLQQRVFAALQQLPGWQVPPQQEVPTDDRNFSIDIAAVMAAGVRLAVEVDGPSHFVRMGGRWEVEGPTQYRNRALAARGYTVVSIPGWEWRQLKGACQQHQYLQDKIKGATELSGAP